MQAFIERIRAEGSYLGNGIIKVDGFLNHQLDPTLTMEMGTAFQSQFEALGVDGVTRIVTAEVSGIAPALAAGVAYNVPIVFARKKKPITMTDGVYEATAKSRTKGNVVTFRVSPDYLTADDRVLIIDDFLARGETMAALCNIVTQSGAQLLGIGTAVEKLFEGGRNHIHTHVSPTIPIVSLAKIDLVDDNMLVS